MEALVDSRTQVEYVIDIDICLLTQLHPKPLRDFASFLNALLVFNVQLFKLNNLSDIAFCIEVFTLSWEDLFEICSKVLDDSQAQRITIVGICPIPAAANKGKAGSCWLALHLLLRAAKKLIVMA